MGMLKRMLKIFSSYNPKVIICYRQRNCKAWRNLVGKTDDVKLSISLDWLSWTLLISDAEEGGKAPFCAQMTTVTAFLVYVNFVKDVIFGSKFSNILRTVAVRGLNSGERVVECFNKRMYVPLKYNTFNKKLSFFILPFLSTIVFQNLFRLPI